MTDKYVHQQQYVPDHDYMSDKLAIDAAIQARVKEPYRNGHANDLGSMAMLSEKLEDMHYGQACAMKKELKRVVDYIYYYSTTGHELYKYLAEDAFKHVGQLHADITDPADKAHAQHFLDIVKEHMMSLHSSKDKMQMPAHSSGVAL